MGRGRIWEEVEAVVPRVLCRHLPDVFDGNHESLNLDRWCLDQWFPVCGPRTHGRPQVYSKSATNLWNFAPGLVPTADAEFLLLYSVTVTVTVMNRMWTHIQRFCDCNDLPQCIFWINGAYRYNYGARGGAVGWGTALQAGRSRVSFPMVSLEFFIDIIFPAALWPWGWLSV
jgi:hypothetical protein